MGCTWKGVGSAGIILVLGGCALFPSGGVLPSGGGTYQGYIQVEDQELWATMRLAPSGDEIAGELRIREGPSAAGMGELDGDRLFLGLRYAGDCSGQLVLRGDFRNGGEEISGDVQAADCTGQMTGTFTFHARPEGVSGS